MALQPSISKALDGSIKVTPSPPSEALGMLLSKAFQGGLLEGFRVGNENMMMSHLQFANDTLVFLQKRAKPNENLNVHHKML